MTEEDSNGNRVFEDAKNGIVRGGEWRFRVKPEQPSNPVEEWKATWEDNRVLRSRASVNSEWKEENIHKAQ